MDQAVPQAGIPPGAMDKVLSSVSLQGHLSPSFGIGLQGIPSTGAPGLSAFLDEDPVFPRALFPGGDAGFPCWGEHGEQRGW